MLGTKWLHHLFNPHCIHCKEDKQCLNCDTLRSMLESERYEKKQILDRLLDAFKVPDATVPRESEKEFKPLGKPFKSWRVRQEELERADKEAANARGEVAKQVITEAPKIMKDTSVDTLEQELGVSNG